MADEPQNDSDGLSLPGGLGRRVGPLPLGAWVGAAGLGLVLAYVWNKRRASGEGTSAGDETTTDPSAADASAGAFLPTSFVVGGGGVPATGNTGGGSVTGDGVPSETTPTGFTNNAAWKSAALSALIAKGYAAVVADDALSRYLESQTLTAQQAAMVNQALQLAGPVPDPVPASPSPPPDPTQPTSQPTPAPTPAPAPAAPAAWVKPPWLGNAKFLIGDHGGAVYIVTAQGISPVPSEDAFRNAGGGGTVNLIYPDGVTRPHTYGFAGTPPVAVPESVLNTLPRV